ncbi:MAG: dehydratase [Hyphomicrobiaceae bacterium]|nr:dehydratase [Hyphomicrobiaceae bacterium]
MPEFYVSIGQSVSFSKTVSETDVYLFAGITGDLAPVHVNQQLMEGSAYGQRIAHGALLVGFMSTLSTMMVATAANSHSEGETPVSLGYDRIRFVAPVFFGDTVTLTYTISEVDTLRRRSTADIAAVNQRGETVAVASHVLKWVKKG